MYYFLKSFLMLIALIGGGNLYFSCIRDSVNQCIIKSTEEANLKCYQKAHKQFPNDINQRNQLELDCIKQSPDEISKICSISYLELTEPPMYL